MVRHHTGARTKCPSLFYAWNLAPTHYPLWAIRFVFFVESISGNVFITHTHCTEIVLFTTRWLNLDGSKFLVLPSSILIWRMQKMSFSSAPKMDFINYHRIELRRSKLLLLGYYSFITTTHKVDPFIVAAAVPANVDVKKGILHSNHVPVQLPSRCRRLHWSCSLLLLWIRKKVTSPPPRPAS